MDHHRLRHVAGLLGLIALVPWATPGLAQGEPGRSWLYKLSRASTFQRGCFEPCMCPLMETIPLRGTFRLRLAGVGDEFDSYAVHDVRWTAGREPSIGAIRGSGSYHRSVVAGLEQLKLELTVGAEPATVYDSGVVERGKGFPAIEAQISVHGRFCFDTVMDVLARPASRLRVERDALEWDADPDAETGYEVVGGDLGALREAGGAFEMATAACLADGFLADILPYSAAPEPGTGWWFLMRAEGDSFDDGDPAQRGSANDGIEASPDACR